MPTDSAPATIARLDRLRPGGGDRDQPGDRHADVADAGQHRVLAAGVEPGPRQHRAAQHRLQQPHHGRRRCAKTTISVSDHGRRQADAAERHPLAQQHPEVGDVARSRAPDDREERQRGDDHHRRRRRPGSARRRPAAAAPSGWSSTDWAILFRRSKTTKRAGEQPERQDAAEDEEARRRHVPGRAEQRRDDRDQPQHAGPIARSARRDDGRGRRVACLRRCGRAPRRSASATRQRPSAPSTTSGNCSADWVAVVNDQCSVSAATR